MKKIKLLLTLSLSALLATAGCTGGSAGNTLFDLSETHSSVSDISQEEQSSQTESENGSSEKEASASASSEPSEAASSEPSELVSQQPSEEESSTIEESSTPEPSGNEIYKPQYKHFYPKLASLEKKDFNILYFSARNFRQSAVFPSPISSDELERLMWLLNYDCPELIHVTGDYLPEYNDDERVISVKLYYNMESSEYDACFDAVEAYFDELRTETAEMNELQKETYVFNKLFSETTFTETTKKAGSVYGALIEHESRCEGISKAFAWCMNELGVECFTIAGHPLWDVESLYSSHSWNIIKIDGEYYHVDLAADNLRNYPDEFVLPLYSFFNAYDRWILQTRTVYDIFLDLSVPECTSEKLNYHVMKDCLIKEGDDPEERFKDILSRYYSPAAESAISIRFENKDAYNDFFATRQTWLQDFLNENGYSCSDSFYCNDAGQTMILYTIPE